MYLKRPNMQDLYQLMQKALSEMPFFISVPVMAFIIAFCRPNSDGTGLVGWRRLNQSVMASGVALGALYATEALGISEKWAMVFGIFVGVMGWEYVKATAQKIIDHVVNSRLK